MIHFSPVGMTSPVCGANSSQVTNHDGFGCPECRKWFDQHRKTMALKKLIQQCPNSYGKRCPILFTDPHLEEIGAVEFQTYPITMSNPPQTGIVLYNAHGNVISNELFHRNRVKSDTNHDPEQT